MKIILRLILACSLCSVITSSGAAQATPAESGQASPVVLITGSNRGIGLALAKAYAKSGWRVIATCRDPGKASELTSLAATHPNVVVEALDVASEPSIAALVAKYRGKPIDVLVNNAGTSGNYAGQVPGQFDETAFTEIMRVNAFAPLRISTAFLDNVSASEQRKIIAISSGRGSVSKPFLERGRTSTT